MPSVRHIGYFPRDTQLDIACWLSRPPHYEESDELPIVQMNLLQATGLFWRARRLSCEFDFIGSTFFTNPYYNNYFLNEQGFGEIAVLNEKDLIKADNRLWHRHPPIGAPIPEQSVIIDVIFDQGYTPLFPQINIRAGSESYAVGTTRPDEEWIPSVGYIEFDMPALQMYDVNSPTREKIKVALFGSPPEGVEQVTGTLRVDEFWEYDPGDGGGPIYSRVTGQQLRPFP